MINQNIIIFKQKYLFEILRELESELNLNISEVYYQEELYEIIKNLNNYLIITNKQIINLNNQLVISSIPIKISKLIELINVDLMRKHFNDQSNIKIKEYIVDINSREIFKNNLQMKLTEKEINTIMYLFKKNKPISIDELEKNVWRYEAGIDTHTVETHIYRLRKKILEKFDDESFITSKKNGYEIN